MAAAFEFTNEGMDRHNCRTWQEGDWIIMQCTQCDFLRKMNWKTGKLFLERRGQAKSLHTAVHQPAAITVNPTALN